MADWTGPRARARAPPGTTRERVRACTPCAGDCPPDVARRGSSERSCQERRVQQQVVVRATARRCSLSERAAELVCPYPPGIPLLLPGERITQSTLDELRAMRDAGCSISGCSDTSLASMMVLGAGGDA